MHEPIKINRVLPPHELNARRARKRITRLPAHVVKPESKASSEAKNDQNHDPIGTKHS